WCCYCCRRHAAAPAGGLDTELTEVEPVDLADRYGIVAAGDQCVGLAFQPGLDDRLLHSEIFLDLRGRHARIDVGLPEGLLLWLGEARAVQLVAHDVLEAIVRLPPCGSVAHVLGDNSARQIAAGGHRYTAETRHGVAGEARLERVAEAAELRILAGLFAELAD